MASTGRIFIYCAVLYQLSVTTWCYGQLHKPDTAFFAKSKKNSIALYASAMQHQSRLYNGSDYVIYQSRDEEHPNFMVDDWTYGSIVYEEELYENVALQYDISIDKVITEHNRGNPIKLLDERIQRFSIHSHTFVRLKGDDSTKITEGFYDQLYDGQAKVYARHLKSYQESLEFGKIIPRFDETTQYYIVKNGSYFPVKTKGSVLKVFIDRKQDIKEFIRKSRINFKKNRVEAMTRVTEFYDTLKK